jgi:PiT family inorganic phosphate transporter
MLMYVLRITVKKRKKIFDEPEPKKAPPTWIRAILITTCTLVSFFHGSNDGQKGVGLLLVVLIAFMPLQFALNHNIPAGEFGSAARQIEQSLQRSDAGAYTDHIRAITAQAGRTAVALDNMDKQDKKQLFELRKEVQSLVKNVEADLKIGILPKSAVSDVKNAVHTLKKSYEFAPLWVIILISLCLGVGTMIGWKRIVVTIGEKIGKTHLSYAQGASAEVCAAATIGVSTAFGLPVSTTHVLSSGIAGTMVASGGVQNLQKKTIQNIALAWILTLPVSFLISAVLFYFLRILF